MNKGKKIVCVIPARLASSRFPNKLLSSLLNKPLLQWVWQAATSVETFAEVVFAIDNVKTADLLKQFNAKFIMTPATCNSGTDRLVFLQNEKLLSGDIWVNWQGDEPFITEKMINTLLQSIETDTADMWTLKKKIVDPEQINASNIAKLVCDFKGYAMYFSRSPIPFYREDGNTIPFEQKEYYKHVGLYAYTSNALGQIGQIKTISKLEEAEKLEQLRFLQYGIKIKVHETNQEVQGIDTPQDLARAEEIARKLLSDK